MKPFLSISAFVFIFLSAWPLPVHADELQTRFAAVEYDNRDALKDFNYALYVGRLKNRIKTGDTIEDEVAGKMDFIVNRVMRILEMYLHDLNFKIVIRGSKSGVQADFKRLYNRDVKYIAFYSPSENTVFFSAKNAKLTVVAHEIGHVVAEHYFDISPPPRIHEVMAQYAEKHITD
ncbi:MAG: hypothetical protein K9K81_09900 [Desulfobacteraceae bacterium]|nr:hypothetical protein [Desulfobacteraceae bacterium]